MEGWCDRMIKVVFLDIDDTLLSFSGYVKEAMREGFARFHLKSYTEDMYAVFERINGGLWRQLEQGTMTYPELWKVRWTMIFDALGIDFDGPTFEEYFRGELFHSAIPKPYAFALLQYLHERYVLCVASNGPYQQQMNRLRIAGMDHYFSHFFISSAVGASKPSQAFFDYCFQVLRASEMPDLQPCETMIIGDSVSSDITGGKAYGMCRCHVVASHQGLKKLSDSEYQAGCLADIMQIL